MFTGIVQAVGRVLSLESGRLSVDSPDAWPGDAWKVGESVAVNGCCLTLVSGSSGLEFDLSAETLAKTALGGLTEGSAVNLERAMRASDRLGGHFVQGHVDTVGRLAARPESGEWEFSIDEELGRYLAEKGSVTVHGVSLTVVRPSGGVFCAALVPHTIKSTNFGEMSEGARVNVEFDVLAKYVEKLSVSPR